MTCVLFDPSTGLTKQRAIEQMAAANIECRPFFPPLSDLPAFAKIGTHQQHPVSQALSLYGINLPSGAQLTQAQVQRVCQTLKNILQESAATAYLAA
jgi:perosamine synthetase